MTLSAYKGVEPPTCKQTLQKTQGIAVAEKIRHKTMAEAVKEGVVYVLRKRERFEGTRLARIATVSKEVIQHTGAISRWGA